jgi:SAM-dependent methyltransferase
VDDAEEAARAAGALIGQLDLGRRVGIVRARIEDTGLAAGSFDVAFMRNVLVHNGPSLNLVLQHIAELLRPGGHLLSVEPDVTGLLIPDTAPDEQDLEQRWISMMRNRGNDPALGPRLAAVLAKAGFHVDAVQQRIDYLAVDRSPAWTARHALLADRLATQADIRRWESAISRRLSTTGKLPVQLPIYSPRLAGGGAGRSAEWWRGPAEWRAEGSAGGGRDLAGWPMWGGRPDCEAESTSPGRPGAGQRGQIMNTESLVREELDRPQTRTAFETAFRSVRLLIGGYVAISVATLVAIVLLRNHHAEVTSAVWIRGIVVVASALLMTLFANRAARGASRMYLRLRLVSAIMVVAIAAIIAIPGTFPVWLKIEQGACGILLIGVVAIVNSKPVRSLFAGR